MFYYPPDVVIEVQTNLNTSLVICPLRNQTILEIKGIIESLHVKLFPQHGEIHVIKVKALLHDEKITVRNGDVIGNIFTEWDGKIIIKADKRKSGASHSTGPNPSLLQSRSEKESASEYNPSHALGPGPSMSNPEILVDPAGGYDPSHASSPNPALLQSSSEKESARKYDPSQAPGPGLSMSNLEILVDPAGGYNPSHSMGPDPNSFYQEIRLPSERPPKRSKPSIETASSMKACEILSLPNSSQKHEDGNDASHATGPNFYDVQVLQKSPLRRSKSSMEPVKLPKAGESSYLPSSSQKSFPTSVSLAGNWMMSRPSTDNNNALTTSHIQSSSLKNIPTSSSLVKLSSRSSRDTNKSPRTCETCGSLVRNLKRSPSTTICVIGPEPSSGRADMTKAFWDFWETFKQRRLKMVAYVPNGPMKPPIGPKRRVIGPKTQKRLGGTGRP